MLPRLAAKPAPARPGSSTLGTLGMLGMLGMLAMATSGCDEPPSYQVRWKLVDEAGLANPDQAADLTSVKQCADVGVSRIQVTTLRLDNTVVDRTEFACFPGAFEDGDAVSIRGLPDGEYKLEVEGLRRSGEGWDCVDDPNTPETDTCIAFAEGNVTIAEGSLPTVEVALLQPPPCDDGIDNDLDGRVDGNDPACILDPGGSESAEASVTLFQLTVTFLDSPAIQPANVSVDALALSVDGEPFTQVLASELQTNQWPFRLPLLAEGFEPGLHDFTIVAVDANGDPLTEALGVEFPVDADSAGFVLEQFDFGADKFLAPIEEPFAFTLGLLLDPDDVTGTTCALGGYLGGALLTLDETWVRVTDTDGQPIPAATLGLMGVGDGGAIAPVDQPGGWISFTCPNSMVVSAPLLWGTYAVEVEGRIGAATCFASDSALNLAPVGQAGAQNFYLDRIVDAQGVPPAGCEECVDDGDCSGQVCQGGICKDKLP